MKISKIGKQFLFYWVPSRATVTKGDTWRESEKMCPSHDCQQKELFLGQQPHFIYNTSTITWPLGYLDFDFILLIIFQPFFVLKLDFLILRSCLLEDPVGFL